MLKNIKEYIRMERERIRNNAKDAVEYFVMATEYFLYGIGSIIIIFYVILLSILFILENIRPSAKIIEVICWIIVPLLIHFILLVAWNIFFFKKMNKFPNPFIHHFMKFIEFVILVFILAAIPVMSDLKGLEEGTEIKLYDQLAKYTSVAAFACIVYAYKSGNYYVKEKTEIKIQGMLTKVYDGKAVENPKVEIKGSEGKVSFQWYERREDTRGNILWDKMMEKPINAGIYGVEAVLEETVKYEGAESKFKDFEIEKAPSTIEIKDNLNKVYDGEVVEDPTDIEKIGSSGAVTYEWYEKEVARSGEETWKLLEKAPQDVGDYKVKANLEADQNYLSEEVEKEFAITEK